MMKWLHLSCIVVLCVQFLDVPQCLGSVGDRSFINEKCKKKCAYLNCSKIESFAARQPFYLKTLRWSCEDECKYSCMWETVDAFQQDGSPVPQFHGKWPFVRLFGIQEPASVAFSILNGLTHLMIFRYRRVIKPTTPCYYIWQVNALVCVNAWFWSSVFHTRDVDFTEKMDYFCALSMILCHIFCLCCRAFGTDQLWKPLASATILLAFFVRHVSNMSDHFDYGYNMQVCITAGVVGGVGWLLWCWTHRRLQTYVWKAATVVLALNAVLSLEVVDFPPIWWTFDGHALWHASTAPVNILWYIEGIFRSC